MSPTPRHSATPGELQAAHEFVRRVRRRVPAELVQAALFGSKARGDARPDSDVDVLLVFRRLPHDREPQATMAEEIAEEVARDTGVPVTTWSVSLVDLGRGRRTPMLVDALADAVPLWWSARPLPPVPFTPLDAARCVDALLERVREGSEEFAALHASGERGAARRRGRDDLVRLCTAWLLLRGVTRPRRAAAVRAFLARVGREGPVPGPVLATLRWAARSFGPHGREEELPLAPPRGGLAAIARAADWLRGRVAGSGTPWPARDTRYQSCNRRGVFLAGEPRPRFT